jgi:hypothetical protein
MKTIVALSDLHLGDPASALGPDLAGDGALSWFRNGLADLGIERARYLVLIGDVLDFSVASFRDAYSAARSFFTALRALDLVEEIIYIPGNHDKDVWDSAQKEVNVFMRVKRGENPTLFPHMQAGIIDLSSPDGGRLVLPGVNYARGRKRKKQYGALFLEDLFPKGEALPVSVVYPNLYLIFPGGGWTLVTHGHLFELAWVFITEVFGKLLVREMDDPPKGGVKWLEECNIPANSLICTGLGQGGPSTRLIRYIQADVKNGRTGEAAKVLRTFLKWLDDRSHYSFPRELAEGLFLKLAEKVVLNAVKKCSSSRGSRNFIQEKKDHILNFLDATRLSLSLLKEEAVSGDIEEYPRRILFGHTHLPIFPEKPKHLDVGDPPACRSRVEFVNTGSCLGGETAAMTAVDENGGCTSCRIDFPKKPGG